MPRPTLWMLLGRLDDPLVPLILPSVAWMAADAGALFECYLESHRSGELFAPTGSMVVSGQHHQAWNYVHARCEVRYIVVGEHQVFASSLPLMGEVIAGGHEPWALYQTLLAQPGVGAPAGLALCPTAPVAAADGPLPISTYLYPDICFARRLAVATVPAASPLPGHAFHVPAPAGWIQADLAQPGEDAATLTARIASRWADGAQGVAFGDPPAILAQLAWHCRARRVAVWGPRRGMPAAAVRISDYIEDVSTANAAAGDLAERLDVPAILGRQTCDGDLFAWSRRGIGMEITDPGRPPLPIVDALPHPWRADAATAVDTPDDADLERWADERKMLSCVLVHSGEIAHNEAMLNLCELAERFGVRMGIGACVGRYRTCPQQWELIATSRDRGGFAGLAEPLLYGNGWGVMAESVCPPHLLTARIRSALAEIRRIAGPGATPRGHYSFHDSDLLDLGLPPVGLHHALADAGLAFDVGIARPGRARILHRQAGFTALNQTCRTIHSGSPYVRIQDPEDLGTHAGPAPGWLICALDAPVVAFQPAIWQRGSRISELFRRLGGWGTPALPSTIARYARILARRGLVPVDRSEGTP
jgi:hypothetical protein